MLPQNTPQASTIDHNPSLPANKSAAYICAENALEALRAECHTILNNIEDLGEVARVYVLRGETPRAEDVTTTADVKAWAMVTLDNVLRALYRLHTGAYGICTHCGHAIHAERLHAIPYTEHCLDCEINACSQVNTLH